MFSINRKLVSAVIYGNDIRFFAALLQPLKRHYISSAVVKKQDPKYRVGDYQLSWVIHNKCLIEEYVELNVPILSCSFEFTRYRDLFRFTDTEKAQSKQLK